ncbi:MAG: hypothetical protein ABFQ95_00230 [Pseudomonadota bacterium]
MTNYFILGIILSISAVTPLSADPQKDPSQAERFLRGFLGGTGTKTKKGDTKCQAEKRKILRAVREDLRKMLSKVEKSLDDLS